MLIEGIEEGSSEEKIIEWMKTAAVIVLSFDGLIKKLSTKAGNLLSDRWNTLTKEAKEKVANIIDKCIKDERRLSLVGTDIILDEYADYTEEALTKKVLYFTKEHIEDGVDENAYKILRQSWDGWDNAKKNKIDEIIQKCTKNGKKLTEKEINDILDNCDDLSVDDVVKRVVWGTRRVYSVDPAMFLDDEAAGVLQDGKYIKNPTAHNINDYIKESSSYLGSKNMNGQYMYVIDVDGNIIIGTRGGQRMPHPTLIGGSNPQVQAAGIVEIRGGKIYSINNASGHYKPDNDCLRVAENLFGYLPKKIFSKDFQGYLPYGE